MRYIFKETILSSIKNIPFDILAVLLFSISLMAFGVYYITDSIYFISIPFIMLMILINPISFIRHHKKLAQEKFDNMSNHEKIKMFK